MWRTSMRACVRASYLLSLFFFCFGLFFLNSHSKHGSLFLSCAVGSVSPSIFLKLVWSLPAKLWAFRCRLIRRLCMKSYQVRENTLGHLENTSLPLRGSWRHTLEEFLFFFFCFTVTLLHQAELMLIPSSVFRGYLNVCQLFCALILLCLHQVTVSYIVV